MFFDYKDWWSWTFWTVIIVIIFELITNLNTLQRWKWGYWSIDLIPATIMLIGLYITNSTISYYRLFGRVSKIEKAREVF